MLKGKLVTVKLYKESRGHNKLMVFTGQDSKTRMVTKYRVGTASKGLDQIEFLWSNSQQKKSPISL